MKATARRKETSVLVFDTPLDELGPAMLACTPLQRRFITAWIASKGKDASRAARAAGYANSITDSAKITAYRNLRNPKIIKAIHEEAGRRLSGLALQAVFSLERNMGKRASEKARQAAADSILDRVGFPRRMEKSVEVEHRPHKAHEQLLALVYERLKGHNISVKELEAPKPDAIEGEFKDAAQDTTVARKEDE
jgi:phage terminase small subunit